MRDQEINDKSSVLRACLDRIARLIPPTWRAETAFQVRVGRRRVDALLSLVAPDGATGTFVVDARTKLVGRELGPLLEQLSATATDLGRSAQPLVSARYLSPPLREELERGQVSYADATGNVYLRLDRPALFARDTGAQSDPWRGPGRPRGSLRGETADRLVRALVDFAPPFSLPELAARSDVSTGATYRMIAFLEEQGVVQRDPQDNRIGKGRVSAVAWRRLLERWAADRITRPPKIRRYLAPRGLGAVITSLQTLPPGLEYVLTGSMAAAYFAPYAQATLGSLYTSDPAGLADALGIRQIDTGANVFLMLATDEAAPMQRTRAMDGVRIAAPSQIVVDLMNSPGRGPAEAEALLDWMERNEPDWRW